MVWRMIYNNWRYGGDANGKVLHEDPQRGREVKGDIKFLLCLFILLLHAKLKMQK